jgi:hypothetical protein
MAQTQYNLFRADSDLEFPFPDLLWVLKQHSGVVIFQIRYIHSRIDKKPRNCARKNTFLFASGWHFSKNPDILADRRSAENHPAKIRMYLRYNRGSRVRPALGMAGKPIQSRCL